MVSFPHSPSPNQRHHRTTRWRQQGRRKTQVARTPQSCSSRLFLSSSFPIHGFPALLSVLGLLGRLPEGDAEAGGRDGGGAAGDHAVVPAEAGAGGGDGLLHRQGLPAALGDRVRARVHLHPEPRRVDRARVPLHGFYCWLYSRSTCQTHTSCEVHCGSFNFNWNCSDHVLAHCPQCLPIHSSIHHSCSGHDDWQCDDCDRSHHEETSRRSQNPEELGGDGACSRCHATAGNTTAGEEISGYCPFPSPGQCEDSGLNNSTWCNDWTYNGGCLPSGSNPTPDRCHEHADWGINSQQYYVNLLVLASLLHQGIPVGKQGLHCRIAREKSYLHLAVDGRCNLVDGNELFFWIMVNLLGVLH